MKNGKKLVALLLLLAMSLSLIPTAFAEETVELTFWTTTWRKDAEEGIIADFMKLHPNIVITPTYMSSDDIKTNTKVAASSGTLPDMWYNWSGVRAKFYADNGLCYDLTDYAKNNGWYEKYIVAALEQLYGSDGHLYGVPQNLAGDVIWYRKDIFEKNGLSVPTTFAELEAVCDALIAAGVTPFSTAGLKGWHLTRYSEELLEYYAGAEEHDALLNMEADWSTSEAVTKSFAKLVEWVNKGYFQDGYISEDPNNTKPYVFSGTCAMIADNPGMASNIVSEGLNVDDYGYFAFPTETGSGAGRIPSFGKQCQFNANLTDEKFEAAMLFWDYYYSEESLEAHASIEQPTAIAGAKLSESLAIAEGLLETINENGSFTVLDIALPVEVSDAFFAVQDAVVLGDMAPENAGAEVQAAIDAYKAEQ